MNKACCIFCGTDWDIHCEIDCTCGAVINIYRLSPSYSANFHLGDVYLRVEASNYPSGPFINNLLCLMFKLKDMRTRRFYWIWTSADGYQYNPDEDPPFKDLPTVWEYIQRSIKLRAFA